MELHSDPHPVAARQREIRDLLLPELEQIVAAVGQPRFRAAQLAQWLYSRRVESFEAMNNLPKAFREYLKQHFKLVPLHVAAVDRSTDGTRKLLLRLTDARGGRERHHSDRGTRHAVHLESGRMRDGMCVLRDRADGAPSESDAVRRSSAQIIAAPRRKTRRQLTNYVFMGMGEPLANYPRLCGR